MIDKSTESSCTLIEHALCAFQLAMTRITICACQRVVEMGSLKCLGNPGTYWEKYFSFHSDTHLVALRQSSKFCRRRRVFLQSIQGDGLLAVVLEVMRF